MNIQNSTPRLSEGKWKKFHFPSIAAKNHPCGGLKFKIQNYYAWCKKNSLTPKQALQPPSRRGKKWPKGGMFLVDIYNIYDKYGGGIDLSMLVTTSHRKLFPFVGGFKRKEYVLDKDFLA